MIRAAALAATVWTIALGGSASAAPCPAGTEAGVEVTAPSRVAFGRAFFVAAESTFVSKVSGLRVSFRPTSRSGRLNSAFSIETRKVEFTSDWLAFRKGEGAGRVVAHWTQQRHGEEAARCELSAAAIVHPIRGRLSPVHAGINSAFGEPEFNLLFPCPTGPHGSILGTATSPIRIRIQGAGGRKVVAVPDPCTESRFAIFESRHWAVIRTLVGNRLPYYEGISLIPLRLRHPARIHFRARQQGVALAHGNFRVNNHEKPARRIREGSAAFRDYCIDETRPIRSESGRRFCVYPGSLGISVTDLHWSGRRIRPGERSGRFRRSDGKGLRRLERVP